MDERDFIREIRGSWKLLKERLGIGRFIISERSLDVDDIFRDTALNPRSAYVEIYKTGLSWSNYNILLDDYSYFQFSRYDDANWRLAYLPNPWISGASDAEELMRHWEALEDIGAINHEEASELFSDMPYVGAVPPIRFESAPAQYRELIHPSAHFHIGRHDQNRWPSAISIGPKVFSLIIAKLYYRDAWARQSKLHGADVAECLDEIMLHAMDDTLAVREFSMQEGRCFHFGKNMLRGA